MKAAFSRTLVLGFHWHAVPPMAAPGGVEFRGILIVERLNGGGR